MEADLFFIKLSAMIIYCHWFVGIVVKSTVNCFICVNIMKANKYNNFVGIRAYI